MHHQKKFALLIHTPYMTSPNPHKHIPHYTHMTQNVTKLIHYFLTTTGMIFYDEFVLLLYNNR